MQKLKDSSCRCYCVVAKNPCLMPCMHMQTDDSSDDDMDHPPHWDGPSYHDNGADEETLERLAQGLPMEDLQDSNSSLAKVAAVVACQATPCITPLPDAVAYRTTPSIDVGLDNALHQLKDRKMKTAFAAAASPDNEASRRIMHIDYNREGQPVQARVLLMAPPPPDGTTASVASSTIVPRGQPLPYVLLPEGEAPTLDTTVILHNLDREQEVAFRIIMTPLEQTIAGVKDIPQLKFTVLGSAGEPWVHAAMIHDSKIMVCKSTHVSLYLNIIHTCSISASKTVLLLVPVLQAAARARSLELCYGTCSSTVPVT